MTSVTGVRFAKIIKRKSKYMKSREIKKRKNSTQSYIQIRALIIKKKNNKNNDKHIHLDSVHSVFRTKIVIFLEVFFDFTQLHFYVIPRCKLC